MEHASVRILNPRSLWKPRAITRNVSILDSDSLWTEFDTGLHHKKLHWKENLNATFSKGVHILHFSRWKKRKRKKEEKVDIATGNNSTMDSKCSEGQDSRFMRSRLGHLACSAWRKLKGNLIAADNFLKEGSRAGGVDLLSLVTSIRTWSCITESSHWMLGKSSSLTGWLVTGTASPVGHNTKPVRPQAASGRCS